MTKVRKSFLSIYPLFAIFLVACKGKSQTQDDTVYYTTDVFVEDVTEESVHPSNTKEIHMAVDLGLPSGIKWANTNVGASSDYEFGKYYSLGDILPRENGRRYQGPFGVHNPPYMPSSHPEYKERIVFNILGNPEYDAATANWGDAWRMPSDHEFYEMQTECAWIWITENGNKGYRIIGPNGNNIFLPAAGYDNGDRIVAENEDGYYWKARDIEYSNRDEPSSCLNFTSHMKRDGNKNYGFGLSIRPVTFDSLDITNLKAKEYTLTKSGDIAGHNYVDLGLPSGTKWATMNIDAKNLYDYGSCFEWGANSPDVSFDGYDEKTLGNGEDVKNISGNSKYDAATSMWGETWRLPTNEEIQELVELCQWMVYWKGEDRVYVGTGPNKNMIIFPIYQGNRGRRLSSIWGSEPEYSNTAHYMDLTHVTQYNGTQRPILTTGKQTGQLRIRPVSE